MPVLTLETITQGHATSPVFVELMPSITVEQIAHAEQNGGIYRAVMSCGAMVGIAIVDQFGECSIAVGSKYRKRGIAASALDELLRIAFDECRLQKITAKTPNGRPSEKLAKKYPITVTSKNERETCYELSAAEWQRSKA